MFYRKRKVVEKLLPCLGMPTNNHDLKTAFFNVFNFPQKYAICCIMAFK